MKKITKVRVWARSFERATGKPLPHIKTKYKPASEDINIRTNEMFKGCETILDIKTAYESFWNRLNDYSPLVFVSEIQII